MDKKHSTNYFDTFIEVAEDTKALSGTPPLPKGAKRTIAFLQYEIISRNPYKFTSDEVFFQIFIERNDLTKSEIEEAKKKFFSKGQACFRASPLTKSYGFGIHSNENGKIALYGMETEEYQKYLSDNKIKKVIAMRSRKK